MTKTNVGGLPHGSYIVTDNSAVIETLNKRIENLERYNAGLANESCEQQIKIADLDNANQSLGYECATLNRKVAELEKERDTRDLEQQAKGLTDLAESIKENLPFVDVCRGEMVDQIRMLESRAEKLMSKAKALKEQGE